MIIYNITFLEFRLSGVHYIIFNVLLSDVQIVLQRLRVYSRKYEVVKPAIYKSNSFINSELKYLYSINTIRILLPDVYNNSGA